MKNILQIMTLVPLMDPLMPLMPTRCCLGHMAWLVLGVAVEGVPVTVVAVVSAKLGTDKEEEARRGRRALTPI